MTKEKKNKFQFFIWNDKIQTIFNGLVLLNVFLLFCAVYLQSMYVGFLENKLWGYGDKYSNEYKDSLDKIKIPAYDELEVIKSDIYLSQTGINSLSLVDLAKYYNQNDFENVKYDVGYIQATRTECEKGCYEVTYVFDQKTGLDIKKYSKLLKK